MADNLFARIDREKLNAQRAAYREEVGDAKYKSTVESMTFTIRAFSAGKHPMHAAESVALQIVSQFRDNEPDAIKPALDLISFAYADALDAFEAGQQEGGAG